jgi:hypothetical protein
MTSACNISLPLCIETNADVKQIYYGRNNVQQYSDQVNRKEVAYIFVEKVIKLIYDAKCDLWTWYCYGSETEELQKAYFRDNSSRENQDVLC